MALAQLIITMDSAGTIRCEAPGLNGMRKKIDLAPDWSFLNPMLAAELKAQVATIKQTKQAPSVSREDPQLAREAKIAKARADHLREWQTRFDNATEAERTEMLRRKEIAQQKFQEAEHARAKRVWEQTAIDHGIELADRAIAPSRRPKIARSKAVNNTRLAINITL